MTASQYVVNDAIARSLYNELKVIYRSGSDPDLNLDCLGIAMFSFCAFAYPTCTSTTLQIAYQVDN